MNSRHRAIVLCFFASGFAGLIYEVAWVKLLRLLFGSTVLAVSTILAVYFGGLAFGSFFLGRYADRKPRNLIRTYAVLEFLVAIACIVSPFVFTALRHLYASLTVDASLSFQSASLLKLGFAFAALIVPTSLLGGTFPILVKALSAGSDTFGTRVARLYGINTLGAVCGTLAAGFFLLPWLGIQASLFLAAGIDLIVGIVAWRMARSFEPESAPPNELSPSPELSPGSEPPAPPPTRSPIAIAGIIAGVAGFSSIGLEILLTRAIITLTGSTVYAFSLILAVFLLGIGLGSQLVSRFVDAVGKARGTVGFLLATTGLLVLVLANGYLQLPILRQTSIQQFGYHFALDLALVAGFSILLILPMTLLFGALFPLCTRLASLSTTNREGTTVGFTFAINTVFGIAGSVAVGFWLLPSVGLQASLLWLSGSNVAIGAAALLIGGSSTVPRRVGIATLLIVVEGVGLLLSSEWDRRQLNNDVVLGHPDEDAISQPETNLLFFRDGIDATVSVVEREGLRKLYVNGTIQASNDRFNLRMYDMLAHLPLLLAPNPERVLVIGLGSGITVGTATIHEPRKLTCVEISEDVVAAARFFSEENRGVVDAPSLTMIHDDARSHLFATRASYDVITANAFLPSNAGTGALYAVEHFSTCRERLNPGGIFCQWVPLFALSPTDLRSVVESFRVAFPDCSLWALSSYVLLIGSKGPLSIDLAELDRRYETIRARDGARLAKIKILGTDQILGLCLLGPAGLKKLGAGAPLNTDDRPRIEYSAPRHLDYRENTPLNIDLLESVRSGQNPILPLIKPSAPASRQSRIEANYRSSWHRLAYDRAYAKGDADAISSTLNAARNQGIVDPLADEALATQLSAAAEQELHRGNPARAIERLTLSAQLDRSAKILEQLGVALALAGRSDDAAETLAEAVEAAPKRTTARLQLAVLLLSLNRLGQAARHLEHVLENEPDNVTALVTMATTVANQGRLSEARKHLNHALSISPDHEEAREKLATVDQLQKQSRSPRPPLGAGAH